MMTLVDFCVMACHRFLLSSLYMYNHATSFISSSLSLFYLSDKFLKILSSLSCFSCYFSLDLSFVLLW